MLTTNWIYDYIAQQPKPTKTARRKLVKKKHVIEDLIQDQIKNDKFVLRGVEKAIIQKGYKNNIETNLLLYGILQNKKYKSARQDIDRALILLQNKIKKELQEENEAEEVLQIVISLLH